MNICPECGLQSPPGQPDCAQQRDQLLARDYERPALYWSNHRLAVDAYCLQHSSYVASAKSLAAHLCGLCIAFEHESDAAQLRRLQKWLSTNPKIERPALPSFRGALTIATVYDIEDPQQFGQAVTAWARAVWQAYRDLHTTARAWLALAANIRT